MSGFLGRGFNSPRLHQNICLKINTLEPLTAPSEFYVNSRVLIKRALSPESRRDAPGKAPGGSSQAEGLPRPVRREPISRNIGHFRQVHAVKPLTGRTENLSLGAGSERDREADSGGSATRRGALPGIPRRVPPEGRKTG